jgi:hypothetical protein
VTDEVKFTDAQWDALAQAAEAFAGALDDEQSRLRDLLAKNWAGECVEGQGIFASLKHLLHGENGSFVQAVDSEAQYLKGVATQCRRSKTDLDVTDTATSEQFQS